MNPLFTNFFSKSAKVKMQSIGDGSVIHHILEKKKLLNEASAEHEKIRPLLLLSPGGMGGAIEAGICVALEKLALFNAFDTVVGISAGAATGYFALAGETALGSQIIYEDMVTHHIMDLKRIGNTIDIAGFEKILRSKDITHEKLRTARSDFFVFATNIVTGEGELLNVKKSSDMLSPVVASMCIPISDGGKTEIVQGKKYVDGAVANPLPLSLLVKKFTPTDVLVVLPISADMQTPYPILVQQVVKYLVGNHLTSMVKEKMLEQHSVYNKELAYAIGKRTFPDVRILTIYVKESSINFFSMNRSQLQKAVTEASLYTEKLFTVE